MVLLQKEEQYSVRLDIFEGPLDLLLHLVQKQELDLKEISISHLTDQYLQYLDMMKDLNINVAGEFLVMAATLAELKSRMLLPQPQEIGQLIEGGLDPREELIARLLEYKKYKDAADEFNTHELLGRDVWTRIQPEEIQGEEIITLDTFQLIDAFENILHQFSHGAGMDIQVENFSVKEALYELVEKMKLQKEMRFSALFEGKSTRGELVSVFLALLEMIKIGFVKVFRENENANITIKATENIFVEEKYGIS